jgi:hypothetical protein
LMIRKVQLVIAWFLIALSVCGSAPAWIHRATCDDGHTELVGICECCHHEEDCGSHSASESCNDRTAVQQESREGQSGTLSSQSSHDCESCAICQSLRSANGFGWSVPQAIQSGDLVEAGFPVPATAHCEANFSLFRSRAPPRSPA